MGRSEGTGASSAGRKPARSAAKKAPAKKAAAVRVAAAKKAPAKKAAAPRKPAAKRAPAKKAPAKKAAAPRRPAAKAAGAKKAPAKKQAARGGSSSSARGGGATGRGSGEGKGLVTAAVVALVESIELDDDPHRKALAASALSIAGVIDSQSAVLATAAVSRELRETLRELVGDDGNDGDDDLEGQDLDWGTPA